MKTISISAAAERSFFGRVFSHLSAALATSGVVAYFLANFYALVLLKFATGGGFWVFAIAQIGIVFYLSAQIEKISTTTATALFYIYAIATGVNLGTIFFAFTAASIATTFFVAAGTFAGMAAYGFFTKSDLAPTGRILFGLLWGVILATIVNIFLQSGFLNFAASLVGVFVFVGLVAYDTQMLKNLAAKNASEKTAIFGALRLYLDFINLFLHLLQFFGRARD